MQSLDVISINFWQIVISLANLAILFLILKKLLFKPVRSVLQQRQQELDEKYLEADKAVDEAKANKTAWEEKLRSAEDEADAIIKSASDDAKQRGERLVAEAKDRADVIIRQAQTEAELEMRRADESIRREIIDVSAALTEKILRREINTDDHRAMIDDFIGGMGEDDE